MGMQVKAEEHTMQTMKIERLDKMNIHRNEAYKTLRTNIEFTGERVKVISITSCIPDEGKSNVAMNLSVSLAENGKKVLLIDADMRKSTMAGHFKIKNMKKGLSHFLSGQCEKEEIMGETNIDGMHMILAGAIPPNPSELLSEEKFAAFLKEMREVYDYIIIDCPPLGSVIDALIPGKLSDGVALVVETENVSYKMVQRIKKQLETAECRILGVILNKVNIKGSIYYKNYYSGCYTSEE